MLKPSTYYLDRIRALAAESQQAESQSQETTSEQAQKAAKQLAEAEEKKREERTRFAKELYSHGFGETMWGQHRSIASQIRNGINKNMDYYVSNPDAFYQDLNQLKSFIDSSEDYYRRTSRSAQDAFVRTTPGAKNPYESDNLVDANKEEDYRSLLLRMNSTIDVNFSPGGNVTIGSQPMSEYYSSFTEDPFQPKLEALPPLTADAIYQMNTSAFTQENKEKWPTIANKIVDEYLEKKPLRILGIPAENQTETAFAEKAKETRVKIVQGLLGQAQNAVPK